MPVTDSVLTLALKRAGRFLSSYVLAAGLTMLASWLSGLAVPSLLTPVIAAIITGIGKYIRETLKIRIPF